MNTDEAAMEEHGGVEVIDEDDVGFGPVTVVCATSGDSSWATSVVERYQGSGAVDVNQWEAGTDSPQPDSDLVIHSQDVPLTTPETSVELPLTSHSTLERFSDRLIRAFTHHGQNLRMNEYWQFLRGTTNLQLYTGEFDTENLDITPIVELTDSVTQIFTYIEAGTDIPLGEVEAIPQQVGDILPAQTVTNNTRCIEVVDGLRADTCRVTIFTR